MAISDYLLYQLAKRWPSPLAKRTEHFGAEPGTDAYNLAYAQHQYELKVRRGLDVSPVGLDVLEIGCGHGGITCYLAAVGARHVAGIDLNTINLAIAEKFCADLSDRLGRPLPVEFHEMDAGALSFPDESFDLVIADSLFEHVMAHRAVLSEAMRVLRPGGKLLVPLFASIYNKYGLHLKHGLKLPWANLVFSEKTICRAMLRLAKDNPLLYETYPGLRNNPIRVRETRRYGDLNGMTYRRFKRDATAAGFKIEWFRAFPTRAGKLIERLPLLKTSRLMDVLSTGAGCLLVKPGLTANESPKAQQVAAC